ncbi:MAG: 50S ribosomal protein L11 methyltransferase [Leptolyngbyaceae cyanobacterium bins.302]|nr:50S ribosomal protein L11 methyltransferase [Leptolyngbyaceae cyanobacterium bins.302]
MSWIELSTDATAEAIDWIRILLASSCRIEKIQISQISDSVLIEKSMQWAFKVQLYLPNDTQSGTKVNQIIQRLSSLQRTEMIAEVQTAIVEELPVITESSPLQRVGRFVILATGTNDISASLEGIPLNIAQSLAFGSGFHPATILCLKLLERYVTPGMHALDLGCGSGILSVAMAKLGATVTAIDNDPLAIAATQKTIQQNGVARSVRAFAGSLGNGSELGHWMGDDLTQDTTSVQPEANFDLIVANIFARIHLSLVNDYRNALRENNECFGVLITAGYDADYEQEINETFMQAGFKPIDREQLGTWLAFAHQI